MYTDIHIPGMTRLTAPDAAETCQRWPLRELRVTWFATIASALTASCQYLAGMVIYDRRSR